MEACRFTFLIANEGWLATGFCEADEGGSVALDARTSWDVNHGIPILDD